ncbi:HPr(Ser) kinase/phosphatase [Gudongella oleilytica]|jgi:HPr kinase/phosphorylase|uniref:HPr(Ser) kinase/phosphatase n=1 Tax=Gudongella oleilytica TaxID=1582259 RepID=UPI000ED7219A|nr:HPr(Ser) kinase/phosphatase [Gudongella oleilytica]MDY0256439.1 HPr(Ser) kinase/phosphatase [Gudongella oleilytica]HCO18272.1 HPr(Ser) kinase/phosphatase [Tissierellales bacterium]
MDHVLLIDLINELGLERIYVSDDVEYVRIETTDISRPGLQMAGYYEKFVPERVQVIGSAEWHFLRDMDESNRLDVLEKFIQYPIPVIIVTRGNEVFPELIELSKKYNKTLLYSEKTTSKVIGELVSYLGLKLAPETSVHGVLLEVFGVGVLLTGKSGIGKSETALDLITRGCRLISDDIVEIKRVEDTLRGSCPELTRYFLEIRGIGILDIERLYGISAVKQYDYLDMVVELEAWNPDKEYDRVGLEEETIEILGIKLPKVTIPVKPGRSIAMIVEVAAKNNRQKRLGYNAAEELNERVSKSIQERKANKHARN